MQKFYNFFFKNKYLYFEYFDKIEQQILTDNLPLRCFEN
jgi:hypothetical protein